MFRVFCISLLVLLSSVVNAQQYNPPEAEGEGRIAELNFGNNSMVVGGYDYQVSDAVQVQINGSYGAFTMLEEEMLIEFTFQRFDDGVRRIVTINEVNVLEEY